MTTHITEADAQRFKSAAGPFVESAAPRADANNDGVLNASERANLSGALPEVADTMVRESGNSPTLDVTALIDGYKAKVTAQVDAAVAAAMGSDRIPLSAFTPDVRANVEKFLRIAPVAPDPAPPGNSLNFVRQPDGATITGSDSRALSEAMALVRTYPVNINIPQVAEQLGLAPEQVAGLKAMIPALNAPNLSPSIQLKSKPMFGPEDSPKLVSIPSGWDADLNELAATMKVGQVAIGLFNFGPNSTRRDEDIKEQIGHVVLLMRTPEGIDVIENPEGYSDRLRNSSYNSVLVYRPDYDSNPAVTPDLVREYENNQRLLAVLTRGRIPFAGENINGGDPLGARDAASIALATRHALGLVADVPESQTFYRDTSANGMYCAEYGGSFIPTAGHQMILSESKLRSIAGELGIDGDELVATVKSKIAAANEHYGEGYIWLPPEGVKPLNEVVGQDVKPVFGQSNFADIVQGHMMNVVPRGEQETADVAVAQSLALVELKKRFERLNADTLAQPAPDGQPIANHFNAWFGQLLQVVGTVHNSPEEFGARVRPLIAAGHQFVGDITFFSTHHLARNDDNVRAEKGVPDHLRPLIGVEPIAVGVRPEMLE